MSADAAPASLWQMLHRNAVRVRSENSRDYPNRTNSRWRALGQAIAFFAMSFGKEILSPNGNRCHVGLVMIAVLINPNSVQTNEDHTIDKPQKYESSSDEEE